MSSPWPPPWARWLPPACLAPWPTPARLTAARSGPTAFTSSRPTPLFGATSIRVTGTTCARARPIARKYVRDPFSVDSPRHRTRKVDGWSCTWGADLDAAQQVSVTCSKPGATIRFHDTLPNG